MKRLILATLVLATAAGVCCALRNSGTQLRRQAADQRGVWMTQTQLIAQARVQLASLEERVRDLKENQQFQRQTTARPSFDPLLLLKGGMTMTAAQSEQLLAELGFNWSSTGDSLVVSKDTLRKVSLNGMRGLKLNAAAAEVLAVTPDERATIEAMTQQLGDSYKTWAEAHVQRQEPAGEIVASYLLTPDPAFSQSISNQFTSGIAAVLGDERAALLRQYSAGWMTDLGMNGGGEPATLTVKRYQAGHLNVEVGNAQSRMSTEVSPYQPFPTAFAPLFPNGWTDLAAREGFELTKDFQTK